MYINTDAWSDHFRSRAVDVSSRRLLITKLSGSEQERDLTIPPNCNGFGRIRHFYRSKGTEWLSNPLPLDPACKALGMPTLDLVRAQVFQLAVCNWRCWYCFVPFQLLSGNPRHSAWITAQGLLDLYLGEVDPPPIIDLTGGQPDLVPEWVPWMIEEVRERGLDGKIYLWSDDNLSNDFFWRYLSDSDRELMATYPYYGRVGCFKGFDARSFSFNTAAHPELFDFQFKHMERLLQLGMDIYAYVTLTTPEGSSIEAGMKKFIDRLQELDENLPLRTVPLKVIEFSPVTSRLDSSRSEALRGQNRALEVWEREIEARFSSHLRRLSIADVPLGHRRNPWANPDRRGG